MTRADFVPWGDLPPRFNAGVRCDMLYGPCACGATHERMTVWERRAQSISFAVGNLLIDRPDYDEWILRKHAADAWESHL